MPSWCADKFLMAAAILSLVGPAALAATPPKKCEARTVSAADQKLWVDVKGNGPATVVFESGNGNDSTVWNPILDQIHEMGAKTFVYDRAGLGKSSPRVGTYSIDREVRALRSALDRCGVRKPIVIVAHSYGGLMALLTATLDRRVAGIVLLDALVPQSFTDSEIAATLAEVRPQYAEVRREAPQLAETVIPLMEAMPATARRIRGVTISKDLPIIDVVSGKATYTREAAREAHISGHTAFVKESTAREYIVAAESSHKIVKDQPKLVVDAVKTMLERIK